MPKYLRVTFILFLLSIFSSCSNDKNSPTLILHNGKIVTVESDYVAEALAVKGDKIIAVGTNNDILHLERNTTQTIDLKGKTVIPGFIDSHAHFLALGESKIKLDLMNVKNWDEIVLLVKEAVAKANPGEWIIGRGWHQEKWNKIPSPNVKGFPVHDKLSEISPNNPVYLYHASGHAILVNQKAMELAGITDKTLAPAGGEIIRNNSGKAIGVFSEDAESLIQRAYKQSLATRSHEETINEKIKAINFAEVECLKNGVTSFHDAGSSYEDVNILKSLAEKGELDVRLFVMLSENNDSLLKHIKEYKMVGFGNNHLTVNAIKRLVDGALGSRGAWLIEEYSDMPGHFGLNVTTPDKLEETANIALENGFQLCTHAIGDRGNREVLDVYEKVIGLNNNKRWRIEHAQHLNPEEFKRFVNLNVSAAMQGIHCTSDAPYVEKRLGEKRAKEGAYVWRKLIDLGINVSNGTDAPVERLSPIENYYASVTRKLKDGTEFYPNQKMTRMEALESYTIKGAYAAFEENIKGSISKGKLADMVVLSQNILEVPDEEILKTEIIYTIVGGKIKFNGEKIRN